MYQFFKKYQVEHEKKFPSKGEELAKRWKNFEENQKKVITMKDVKKELDKEEAEKAKSEVASGESKKSEEK